MTDVRSQLGMAAASAGWRAGREAVQSGALRLDAGSEVARNEQIEHHAADHARAYMRQAMGAHQLTEAEGVRLFSIYMVTFARGVRHQTSDGG